jgi:hypothetical protein
MPIFRYWHGTEQWALFFSNNKPASCIERISLSNHYSEIKGRFIKQYAKRDE